MYAGMEGPKQLSDKELLRRPRARDLPQTAWDWERAAWKLKQEQDEAAGPELGHGHRRAGGLAVDRGDLATPIQMQPWRSPITNAADCEIHCEVDPKIRTGG